MSLLERFRTLGGKLGILAVAPAKPKAEPVKLEMRTVTLSELTQELGAPDLSKLAEAPEFLNLSWPEVYAAAGVQPPEHGWGVEKLAATLKSEAYAKLERTAVQAELARLFVSQEAVLETVQEAVARDQALDRFELAARMKLDQRAARRKKRSRRPAPALRGAAGSPGEDGTAGGGGRVG